MDNPLITHLAGPCCCLVCLCLAACAAHLHLPVGPASLQALLAHPSLSVPTSLPASTFLLCAVDQCGSRTNCVFPLLVLAVLLGSTQHAARVDVKCMFLHAKPCSGPWQALGQGQVRPHWDRLWGRPVNACIEGCRAGHTLQVQARVAGAQQLHTCCGFSGGTQHTGGAASLGPHSAQAIVPHPQPGWRFLHHRAVKHHNGPGTLCVMSLLQRFRRKQQRHTLVCTALFLGILTAGRAWRQRAHRFSLMGTWPSRTALLGLPGCIMLQQAGLIAVSILGGGRWGWLVPGAVRHGPASPWLLRMPILGGMSIWEGGGLCEALRVANQPLPLGCCGWFPLQGLMLVVRAPQSVSAAGGCLPQPGAVRRQHTHGGGTKCHCTTWDGLATCGSS